MGILGRSEEVVKAQISEALVLLCSQLFQYDLELSVEALVGVKLDRKEIFLYNVQSSALKESKKAVGKRSSQDEDDIEAIMIEPESDEDYADYDNTDDDASCDASDAKAADTSHSDERGIEPDQDRTHQNNAEESKDSMNKTDDRKSECDKTDVRRDECDKTDDTAYGITDASKMDSPVATDDKSARSKLVVIHNMETRRKKRKRLETSTDDEDQKPITDAKLGKCGGLDTVSGLHIESSYSLDQNPSDTDSGGEEAMNVHVEKAGKDADLVFIKEEVQDPAYCVSSTSTPTSTSKVLLAPVASTPPQTIILPSPVINTPQTAFQPPILIPANPGQAGGNRPLVFFTKNADGQLVPFKPGPNVKIILPTTTTPTLTKTTPRMSSAPPTLATSPGLSVLHNLESQAEMRPPALTPKPRGLSPAQAITQPPIRIIRVGPEAAKGGDEEPSDALSKTKNQSTVSSTHWGIRRFQEWLENHQQTCDLQTISPSELNDILCKFYSEVKPVEKSKVTVFTPATMTCLRAAIRRHITEDLHRNLDIVSDINFLTANYMFKARCKMYAKAGHSKPKHKSGIGTEDMQKLCEYFSPYRSNPNILLEAVWFYICYYFGHRSREDWARMTKSMFKISHDSKGQRYVHLDLRDCVVKEQQCGHTKADMDNGELRMYGQGAQVYEFYLTKLSPNFDRLFQYPKSTYSSEGIWYKNAALGKNRLAVMMNCLSQKAGLSQIYTCRSVRGSHPTKLFPADGQTSSVMHATKQEDRSCDDTEPKQEDYSNMVEAWPTKPHTVTCPPEDDQGEDTMPDYKDYQTSGLLFKQGAGTMSEPSTDCVSVKEEPEYSTQYSHPM